MEGYDRERQAILFFLPCPTLTCSSTTRRTTATLKVEDHVYLNINAAVMGLGNSSCGPGVLTKYAIKQQPYSLHLRFTKIK